MYGFIYKESDGSRALTEAHNQWMDRLWAEGVWKLAKTNPQVSNRVVRTIFDRVKLLESECEPKVKFSIGENYDVRLVTDDRKKKKKKLGDFKKDNLHVLKIHSDCFVEYLQAIFDYMGKKKKVGFYEVQACNQPHIPIQPIPISVGNVDYMVGLDEVIDMCIHEFIGCVGLGVDDAGNMQTILEQNVQKIRTYLEKFLRIIDVNTQTPVLLIDVENILKSFEVQNFLRGVIGEKEWETCFDTWIGGKFEYRETCDELGDLTISEYSERVRYVEPYTSLDMGLETKLHLTRLVCDMLLDSVPVVSVLTFNMRGSATPKPIHNQNPPQLHIPIHYKNKHDVREQDDQLLILLHMILERIGLCPIIISSDKFKWFKSHIPIQTLSFKTYCDYDKGCWGLTLDIPYTPPVYKINSVWNAFPFIRYPQPILPVQISHTHTPLTYPLTSLTQTGTAGRKLKKLFEIKPKKIRVQDIQIIHSTLYDLCILEPASTLVALIRSALTFCFEYLVYVSTKFGKISQFLLSNSREQIFRILVSGSGMCDLADDVGEISQLLDSYVLMVEIYIVLKFGICRIWDEVEFDTQQILRSLSTVFDVLVGVYDLFDAHIEKIRKLGWVRESGSSTEWEGREEVGELFNKINRIYIQVRKQGYMKKNIF